MSRTQDEVQAYLDSQDAIATLCRDVTRWAEDAITNADHPIQQLNIRLGEMEVDDDGCPWATFVVERTTTNTTTEVQGRAGGRWLAALGQSKPEPESETETP